MPIRRLVLSVIVLSLAMAPACRRSRSNAAARTSSHHVDPPTAWPAASPKGYSQPAGATAVCAPLPPPSGAILRLSPADGTRLPQAISAASAGSTIVLADGTYVLSQGLRFRKPGVTLRSASNQSAAVVLDGRYAVPELVVITASNVTIAHLTLTRAADHPVHLYPPGSGINVKNPRLYGLRIIDGGQQFVKSNPIAGQSGYVDGGQVACSHFLLSDAGRRRVEASPGGCYTGGIDVHAGWRWVVSHNAFEGIYCKNGSLAEHAIHFWRGCRDTLVQNNRIINCARGIGLGLGGGKGQRIYPDLPYGGATLAHYDGIVRNNVIFADIPWYDTGIELHDTRRPVVVHNTVVSTAGASSFFSSIDYRFAQTDVVIQNNLTRRITMRDGARGVVSHNMQNTPLAIFVNAAAGDFHLRSSAGVAINRGAVISVGGLDLDGQPHSAGLPDLGADEVGQ